MPSYTRAQRREHNDPLLDFDLDPFGSNIERFPTAPPPRDDPVDRVAQHQLPSISSLTTLSDTMSNTNGRSQSVPVPEARIPSEEAHISPIPSNHSIHDQDNILASNFSARPSIVPHSVPSPQPRTPRTPELDPDALFDRFNRELSLVPASKVHTMPPPKVKQPWENRVKEFDKSNHLQTDGSNFISWRRVQLVVLRTYKWIGHAEGTEPAPLDTLSPEYDLWQTVDNLTISQLAMNMNFDLYGELSEDLHSAAELWRAIQTRFSQKTAAARSTSKLNLDKKKIQPGETMKDHITKLRNLKARYLNSGGTMDDVDWHTTVLNSLSEHDQWKTLTVFGYSLPQPDTLIGFLEDQDARGFITTSVPKLESALQSQSTLSRPGPRPRFRYRSNYVCSNCSKLGHTIQDCWAPGGGSVNRRPANYRIPPHMTDDRNETANVAKIIQHRIGDAAMIASEAGVTRETWLYDTGASSHMTNDITNFASFEEMEPLVVATADDRVNTPLLAIGKGTVMGRFYYENEITVLPIKDVLYVPNLSQNLISYIEIDKRGVRTASANGTTHFLIKGVAYAKAVVKGKQVIMQMDVQKESAHLSIAKNDVSQPLHVWHQRLNHIDPSRVQELVRDNLVDGIVITSSRLEPCEPCVLSKMSATHAQSRELCATEPGDIVHCDIEFMGHKSLSGAAMSLKFLDEYSNYVWCHPIADKSADTILSLWKNLCALLKTQHNVTVKAIHSDNGPEFVNAQMNDFNHSSGITHHLTVPYRHEMNGRIERMNRTGSNAVRTMLEMAKLPYTYWAEAYNTFGYVHNRCAKTSGSIKTPFETLHGSKPTVDHIRMFGATGYVRVAPEKRKKLEPKARKMILVGYRDNAAYRMIDPLTKQIVYSRDVTFDEFQSCRVRDLHLDRDLHVDPPLSLPPLPPLSPPLRSSSRIRTITPRALESIRQQQDLKHLDRKPSQQERVHSAVIRPNTVQQALASPEAAQWHSAMVYEIAKLNEMEVWDVVEMPKDDHVIGGMWVFVTKEQADGTLEYQARWVARGDSQVPGLEFGETFAASGDFISARLVCALSCEQNSTLVTLDISSAYLYSPLSETNLFVEYPTSFSVPGFQQPCCHLKKALYGLRQGARAWSDHFSDRLASLGFKKCISAPTVYIRSNGEGGRTIISTHVDDSTSCHRFKSPSDQNSPEHFKSDIETFFKFKIKNPEQGANVLGLTLMLDARTGEVKLTLTQKIQRALERYGMENAHHSRTPMDPNALAIFANDLQSAPANPEWPYAQLVGELLWFATILRVDIAFAANLLARYLQKPTGTHWNAALRVLRYLAKTKDLGIVYRRDARSKLMAFSDSDWAGDAKDRKSISGYVFMYNGGPIAWKSRKQSVVAKSTAEAEYLAVSACAQEAVWLSHLLNELELSRDEPIDIHVDNQAAILMTKNPVYLSKTKHIDIPAHHIRDEVDRGRIRLVHIDGQNNPADILTKPLGPILHERCLALLGLE